MCPPSHCLILRGTWGSSSRLSVHSRGRQLPGGWVQNCVSATPKCCLLAPRASLSHAGAQVPCAFPCCRKALTRYQMLFRHMFYCKHVERQLCSVWISNKAAKQRPLRSAKWYVSRLALGPSRVGLLFTHGRRTVVRCVFRLGPTVRFVLHSSVGPSPTTWDAGSMPDPPCRPAGWSRLSTSP